MLSEFEKRELVLSDFEPNSTPTPWLLDEVCGWIDNPETGEPVCMLDANGVYAEQDRVNAAIIQEAPKLLKSLRELLRAMRDYEMSVDGRPPKEHREMMQRAYDTAAAALTPLTTDPDES